MPAGACRKARGRAPQRAAAAALGALGAATLQGCQPDLLREEPGTTSATQLCPSIAFGNGGFVSESRAGDAVEIHCPADTVYDGPVVECGWVDRFCVAESPSTVDPELCWDQYNLTLAGGGLSSWPLDVAPRVVAPLGELRALRSLREAWRPLASDLPGRGPGPSAGAQGRRLAARPPPRPAGVGLPAVFVPDEAAVCKDEGYVDLDLDAAEVTRNRLGGVGPDAASGGGGLGLHAAALVYQGVAEVGGQAVDLVVTTNGSYSAARPERNGKGSATGRVNINATGPVPLRLRFVRSGSDRPVVLEKLFLTLFAIAAPAAGGRGGPDAGAAGLEVSVGGVAEYFTTALTSVAAREEGGCSYTFGSIRGPAAEAPTTTPQAAGDGQDEGGGASVEGLWLDVLNRSLALAFRGVSEVELLVRAPLAPRGVELEFAGWSEVVQVGSRAACRPAGLDAKFARGPQRGDPGEPVGEGSLWAPARLRSLSLAAAASAAGGLVALAAAWRHWRRPSGRAAGSPHGEYGKLALAL